MIHLKGSDYYTDEEKIAVTDSFYIEKVIEEHVHDFYEIVYVINGSGFHITNSSKHFIGKGTLLLIAPNASHTFEAGENLCWINVLFDKSLIEDNLSENKIDTPLFFKHFSSDITKFNVSNIEYDFSFTTFETIFKDMLREFKNKREGYVSILYGYLQVIIKKLCRMELLNTEKDDSHEQISSMLLDYLNRTPLTEISIDDIAKKLYVTPRYFQNLFKKQTGENLTTFIRRFKINKACSLLLNTDKTIEEIMLQINMCDTKNFYGTFKKFIGCTPHQYRNNNKKN